jgi:hypothetical protein
MPRLNPFATSTSPPVKAAGLLIFACIFFASMNAIIRYVSVEVDPLEIVFFRNFFGFAAMLPWLMRRGFGVMRTKRLGMIAMRSFWGFLAMATWFSALAIVPFRSRQAYASGRLRPARGHQIAGQRFLLYQACIRSGVRLPPRA